MLERDASLSSKLSWKPWSFRGERGSFEGDLFVGEYEAMQEVLGGDEEIRCFIRELEEVRVPYFILCRESIQVEKLVDSQQFEYFSYGYSRKALAHWLVCHACLHQRVGSRKMLEKGGVAYVAVRGEDVYTSLSWSSLVGRDEGRYHYHLDEWLEPIHHEDQQAVAYFLKMGPSANVVGENPVQELRVRHSDGGYRWLKSLWNFDLGLNQWSALVFDVTKLKVYDPLSGIPNRVLFIDRLKRTFENSRSGRQQIGVILLDLDHFNVINDSLGPHWGDKLLIQVANRLQRCLRPPDIAARLSGDQFAVLVENIDCLDDVNRVAIRVKEVLKAPFKIEDKEIFATASVGIAFSKESYDSYDEILRDADIALNRSKLKAQGLHTVFEEMMHDSSSTRFQLQNDLRKALSSDQLEVYYQPIIDLEKMRLIGFESLVRWNHPTRGLVTPDEFLPVAEEMGLLTDIDRWVMEKACVQVQEWSQKFRPFFISVNVSPTQFTDGSPLLKSVGKALSTSSLSPSQLCIELTESTLLEHSDSTESLLEELKSRSIRLSLDDFGTGYSSLSYLSRLPVSCLKIDKVFVQEIDQGIHNYEVVRGILSLARSFGFLTVAEGIETEDQLKKVVELGCDWGQGYLFSRPLPKASIIELLQTSNPYSFSRD